MTKSDLEALKASIKTLDDLVRQWRDIQNDRRRLELWTEWLINPKENGWLKLCKETRKSPQDFATFWLNDGDPENILSYLGGVLSTRRESSFFDQELLRRVRAMLRSVLLFYECGNALQPLQMDLDVIRNLAREIDVPTGFLHDLNYIMNDKDRTVVSNLETRVLLIMKFIQNVSDLDKGVVAGLKLELMPDGEQDLYVHPEQAFIELDVDFYTGLEAAKTYLQKEGLWPKGYDIRWRITLYDNNTIEKLKGGSASAAFAMAGEWVLAELN